ncbi:hypothetical protein [Pareuzebyella sediminis]|uniref:hypothetical protein n=1 Tax=Pareuzebyella sediminis TaxID=2607998 RepID=UPI0011F00F56|nr:hypothetical protein [Pareuzebyella sediminis]
MTHLFKRTGNFMALAALTVVVFSCSKDDKDTLEQDEQVSQTELKTILEIDALSSVADQVVADLFNADNSGGTAKTSECYGAVYTDTGFSVTFNDCSVDNVDNVDGTLTVVYGQQSDSHAFSVTYDNLTVGTASIDGTRTFTLVGNQQESSVSFIITSDMTLTLGDGSEISEKGSKTFAFIFGETLGESKLTIDGEWMVKANGNTYSIDVSELLEAGFGCDYIGKGLMALNKNGLQVSVDFGDGTCDDVASIIYPDGTNEEVSLED